MNSKYFSCGSKDRMVEELTVIPTSSEVSKFIIDRKQGNTSCPFFEL